MFPVHKNIQCTKNKNQINLLGFSVFFKINNQTNLIFFIFTKKKKKKENHEVCFSQNEIQKLTIRFQNLSYERIFEMK